MSYPFDMIRTIARGFYIRPTKYNHSGFDWTPMNDEWEKLSNEERQPWYDIAIKWLEMWKTKCPEVHDYYISQWIPDLGTEGYNDLISIKSIAI